MSGPVQASQDGNIARPDDLLAGVGGDAWQAYNAMQATKQRHFERLEAIDLKKRNYNIDPTPADRELLAHLLADHDGQVKRFTDASVELKNVDQEAHTALFVYIGAINSLLSEPHTH